MNNVFKKPTTSDKYNENRANFYTSNTSIVEWNKSVKKINVVQSDFCIYIFLFYQYALSVMYRETKRPELRLFLNESI